MIDHTGAVKRTGVVAIAHNLFCHVVKTILETELGFEQVVAAGSLDDVLDRLTKARSVDLLVFDMAVSGVSEASHLSILRECFPDVRLVVSGPMRRADMLHALHAGVHGYISDAMNVQDLTQALAMVVEGKIFVPDIVADLAPRPLKRAAALACEHRRASPEIASPPETTSEFSLTPRQQDVLRLIIKGQSNKEIARTLNLRESTVKVHLAAVFRVLGVHNRSGAAGRGIHFIDPAGGPISDQDGNSIDPEPPAQSAD